MKKLVFLLVLALLGCTDVEEKPKLRAYEVIVTPLVISKNIVFLSVKGTIVNEGTSTVVDPVIHCSFVKNGLVKDWSDTCLNHKFILKPGESDHFSTLLQVKMEDEGGKIKFDINTR